MSSRESLRASDSDRERAVTVLHDAATEGRLDADELDERVARAFSATTYGELDSLVEDLPMPVRTAAPARTRPARAGWWPRLGACLIDGLLVSLVAGLLSAALHGVGGGLAVLVSAIYFTVLEGGERGAGAGKMALGLRVVDTRTGGPIGYPRAFVRWVTRIVSAMAFFIGYLWMLGDSERQCWHDKLAGDVVVHT
ncbi:MAG: RDD family protein, partial [Solirubrobacteraceae bacterium]